MSETAQRFTIKLYGSDVCEIRLIERPEMHHCRWWANVYVGGSYVCFGDGATKTEAIRAAAEHINHVYQQMAHIANTVDDDADRQPTAKSQEPRS